MSGIHWLASYPKSGNTWLRVFLNNYVSDSREPVSINELRFGTTAYQRELFDEWLGVESADMPCEVIDNYRPAFYEAMCESHAFRFAKTHEQFRRNHRGAAIFTTKATAGVVLVVRNPLDIAVSLARFWQISIDSAISQMANTSMTLSPRHRSLYDMLPQVAGDWSGYISSWLNSGLPVHVTRYEDLLATPHQAFGDIVNFLSLPEDKERLDAAIRFSSFDEVRKQEAQNGFRELHTGARQFFRRGTKAQWQTSLSTDQCAKVHETHGELMARFGYDAPVYVQPAA